MNSRTHPFAGRAARAQRRGPSKACLALAVAALAGSAWAQDAPPQLLDPDNPEHARLQRPADGLAGLPLDKQGLVDWAKALRLGLIKPRSEVRGDKAAPQLLELDIVMKNTAEMPYVKFPHGAHTQWLDCSNCHDKIFAPKAGANPVSMAKIFRGEFCGVCHGRVAFTTLFSCERCHSVLRSGTKPWW